MSYRNIHQTDRPARDASRERVAQKKKAAAERRTALLAKLGLEDRGQSEHDLLAADRGTNASPVSRDFAAAFGTDAEGNRTANKPDAWRQQFEPGGREKRAEAIAAPKAPAGEQGRPANPMQPARGPGKTWAEIGSDVNTPRIQRLLDANVNPGAQQEIARAVATPGSKVGTQYGSISVSNGAGEPKNADGTPVAKAVTTPHGVYRDTASAWQQQIMQAYPEIGQANSPANRAFVAALKKAGAQQGPNASGAAGADPMKIAENVTKDLAREAKVATEKEKEEQVRNALDPSKRIPTKASGFDVGGGVKMAAPVATETTKFGTAGISMTKPVGRPQIKVGDMTVGSSPAGGNASAQTDKVSIGTPSYLKPAPAMPTAATQSVDEMAGVSPSPFATPKLAMPGVPTLPATLTAGQNFFGGPSAAVDLSVPAGLSSGGPVPPEKWDNFGGVSKPVRKELPELEDSGDENASR